MFNAATFDLIKKPNTSRSLKTLLLFDLPPVSWLYMDSRTQKEAIIRTAEEQNRRNAEKELKATLLWLQHE